MKKIVLITAAIVATVGMGYATNSLQKAADHSKHEIGNRCKACNGLGVNPVGGSKCLTCSGKGMDGSY
jgi:DnaJ-class molecular chaperone